MASPDFQVGVGEDAGVSQSTVSRVVWQVCRRIVAKRDEWIQFPRQREMRAALDAWQIRFSLPFVIGAIDCTHIPIQKPTVYGDEYINRKGFPSINVQATCDAHELFTSVDVSWPGSVHDARILTNSNVYNAMTNLARSHGAVILGDEGYPLLRWLMTPIRKRVMTMREERYNTKHAQERKIIERCFGQLKSRFRMLRVPVRIKTSRVPHFIMAAFILHNVAKKLNDIHTFDDEDDRNDSSDDEDNIEDNFDRDTRGRNRQKDAGMQKRNQIISMMN